MDDRIARSDNPYEQENEHADCKELEESSMLTVKQIIYLFQNTTSYRMFV